MWIAGTVLSSSAELLGANGLYALPVQKRSPSGGGSCRGDQALVELVERLTRRGGESGSTLADRLNVNDSEVPAADAERIRCWSRQRLLQRFALRHNW